MATASWSEHKAGKDKDDISLTFDLFSQTKKHPDFIELKLKQKQIQWIRDLIPVTNISHSTYQLENVLSSLSDCQSGCK